MDAITPRMSQSVPAEGAGRVGGVVVRRARLVTGLVLFGYVLCHFLNHAVGLVSLSAMQAANRVLVNPWTTVPGHVLLYGSFAVHAALGLRALYRRRQLRMPVSEGLQLGLGLLVPVLVIGHAVNVRLGEVLYGLKGSYEAVIHSYWMVSPDAMVQQFALLLVVWVHACIGLHASLRLRRGYPSWRPWLAAVSLMVPLLSIGGVIAAGMDLERALAKENKFAARFEPTAEVVVAREELDDIANGLILTWVVLVAGTMLARSVRGAYEQRYNAVRITYPGGRIVTVPRGFSVLEASRQAGLPHASVCGGRGRCSTCRVRVVGAVGLAEPDALELAALERIGAPPHVRLACQLRPAVDVKVVPLVSPGIVQVHLADGIGGVLEAGQERVVAALFADLRDSTRITAGKLPFDALFLVDCWIQAVSRSVHQAGGRVTSVAGDGVMAVFGVEAEPEQACRQALAAAMALAAAVDELNVELAPSLAAPLRFGVGIHVGPAIVGVTTLAREDGGRSLQFFGDPANVAARLEGLTKERGRTMLASRAVLDYAQVEVAASECFEITVRGRDDVAPLSVCTVAIREALPGAQRVAARPAFGTRG